MPQPLITPKNALFVSEAVQRTHELWSYSPMSHLSACFEHMVYFLSSGTSNSSVRRYSRHQDTRKHGGTLKKDNTVNISLITV